MQTEDMALAQGLKDTRSALERWRKNPGSVLIAWGLGAVGIALLLLAAVLVIATRTNPDLGFDYVPRIAEGPELGHTASVMGRNSLVLALHAMACVAGFIAGSSLPISAQRKSGVSRWIHDNAQPAAFAWVTFVTLFSLVTQAYALGVIGSTLADSAGISPATLLLTVFPHALLELTAVFLPLAAWTMASRRDEWQDLLAATFFTVGVAVPMLMVSALWEVHVWPHLIRAASGSV